jgi:hypothetical protein
MARRRSEDYGVPLPSGLRLKLLGAKWYVFEGHKNIVGPFAEIDQANDAKERYIQRQERRSSEVADPDEIDDNEVSAKRANTDEWRGSSMATSTTSPTRKRTRTRKEPEIKKPVSERKAKERKSVRTPGSARGKYVVDDRSVSTAHVVAPTKELGALCETTRVAKSQSPTFYDEIGPPLGLCWKCSKLANAGKPKAKAK